MTNLLIKLGSLILFLTISNGSWGQDGHFSQYNLAPIFYNPAFAGLMDKESHRIAIKYRNQWSSVLNTGNGSSFNEQAFQTYLLSYDGRLIIDNNFWTFGTQLYTQKVDFPSYQALAAKITGGYHLELSDDIYLGGAFELGWRNYSIGLNDLTFDAQFDTTTGFDPQADKGEDLGANSGITTGFMELGGGLSLYSRGKQTEWIIGGSINSSIVGKDFSFFPNEDGSPLDRSELKSKISIQGNLLLHNRYDHSSRKQSYNIRFLFISQGPHWLLLPSVAYKRYFRSSGARVRDRKREVAFGIGHRISANSPRKTILNDAILVFLSADISPDMTLGISYDFNTSSLRKASNLRGGPELSFIYKVINQKSVPCPSL